MRLNNLTKKRIGTAAAIAVMAGAAVYTVSSYSMKEEINAQEKAKLTAGVTNYLYS